MPSVTRNPLVVGRVIGVESSISGSPIAIEKWAMVVSLTLLKFPTNLE